MKNTFETKVAEACKQRLENQRNANIALLDNDAFMNVQVRIASIKNEVNKLDTIIQQLNSAITPFIAKDGSKYSVRVFSVTQFELGLDRLIGIITGSASAFTDEMSMQYEAITGIPFTELVIANNLLGTVDYINKDGIYVEGSRTISALDAQDMTTDESPLAKLKAVKAWRADNASELLMLLQSIAIKLDIYECLPSVDHLTNMLEKWELSATRRAEKQLKELEKSHALDASSEFTLED